ncbi:hypothetical protein [Dyella sp. OK004]|uniref:hypothetical protein n=1 Tax=Dyella sp. OK004 TaxID=1855292 RepID=UPI000B8261AC|nr:hypothetical protein [Dyella sp. OK004]
MVSIKVFLEEHFGHFSKDDFGSKSSLQAGLAISSAWAVTSSAVVIACQIWPDSSYLSYIRTAIPEAIGPHLWNVIGTIAAMAVGWALLFPRVEHFARFANYLLLTTFGIGILMFGTLAGKLFSTSPPENLSALSRAGLYILVAALMMICFALNFALWIAASLLDGTPKHARFAQKWRQTTLWLRLAIAIAMIALPGYLLVTSKAAPSGDATCTAATGTSQQHSPGTSTAARDTA